MSYEQVTIGPYYPVVCCTQCGALVSSQQTSRHDRFHKDLESAKQAARDHEHE